MEDLRQVTIVFSDLSGYTALSEHLGPEETKEVTSRIFREAAAIARRYEGRLDRLVGDCALILFGIPQLHEDDALRALGAVTELHAFVESLNTAELVARIGRRLAMHTGVNTGTVLAGQTDLEEGSETVVGDAVNLASRLKDAAHAGQILVGPLTWQHTKERFVYRTLEPLSLKGKEKPVQAYELESRKAKETGTEARDREVHSPLVGREKELGELQRLVGRLKAGEGSIVFVRGEAGVGKSRLLAELRQGGLLDGVALLEGSAQSIGRNLSFHPFIEMLDTWAGIREEDGQRETLRKLEAAVLGAAGVEGEGILPFVAILRGLKLEGAYAERVRDVAGDALSKLIAMSVRDLIRAISRQKPVLLLFEDLHWADQSSLELLEGLFRLVEKERVAFVAALRPSEPNTERLVLKAQESYEERFVLTDVPTLTGPESERMLSNLLGRHAPSQSVLDSIIERTGGNPFFMEEVVRSWIDEGAIEVSSDGLRITERIEQTDIPYSVNQAIIARIDRLGEETREVLQVASVIGRSFFYRIIARLAQGAGSLDAEIDSLKRTQLIVQRSRLEEVEYLFKHALVQQAIYDSVLAQARRKLHARVAEVIESIFAGRLPEFYGVLAYHYLRAEDLEKAELYLLKAGDAMLASSASSEAIYFYQEGLRLYLEKNGAHADPLKVARLHKNVGYAYYNKGLYHEAIAPFERALSCLGARPARGFPLLLRAAWGLIRLIAYLYIPGRRRLAQPDPREREIIEVTFRHGACFNVVDTTRFVLYLYAAYGSLARFDCGGVYPLSTVLVGMSLILMVAGALKLARRVLTRAEAVFKDRSYPAEAMLCDAGSMLALLDGTWESPYFDRFRELSSIKGELQAITTHVAFCALLHIERAQWHLAEERIDQLRGIADVFDNMDARVCFHELRGKCLLKTGRAAESLGPIAEGSELAEKAGQAPMVVYFLGMKARAFLMLGDEEGCQRALEDARAAIRKEGMVLAHWKSRYLMARASWEVHALAQHPDRRRTRRARKATRQALACSRNWVGDRTEALRLMGVCFWLRGKTKRALRYWHESIQFGSQIGAGLELARTWAEVGKRLLERGGAERLDGLSAERYLSMAEAFFRENDLAWDLQECSVARRSRR